MSAIFPIPAVSSSPTCGVPPISGAPPAGLLAVVVSSSRIVMVLLPMTFPSNSPATVSVRLPPAASFAAAVTVTSTELSPAGSAAWWPAAFVSASAGLTL